MPGPARVADRPASKTRERPRARRGVRIAAALVAVAAACMLLALEAAGRWLVAPAPRAVGAPPPALAALGARSVVIETAAGEAVRGWFAPGAPGAGAVLLLHGVRGDRRQMAGRARVLRSAGHAVLLVDLPAHGESDGAHITFGHREAAGVRAALRFLRDALPAERTAAVGVSLGAAALVLADAEPPPDAVVLEAMYPTIDEAAANRLRVRLGEVGAALAPVIVGWTSWRHGVAAHELRPIDRLPALRAPLLLVAGTEDRHTTPHETRRLHDAAGGPKALWWVEGAGHVDLHAFAPAAYEANVLTFLAAHLDRRATGAGTPGP